MLFLHWRVPAGLLRPHVPRELEIDTFDGETWVSAVVFRLSVRPRGLPRVRFFSELIEVNLRTYVRHRGVPGINFLSVHADNRLAIAVGKLLTPMPYRRAKMNYRCTATLGEFDSPLLHAGFRIPSDGAEAADGSLDEFLLERYRLYAVGRRGELLQAEVQHPRWRTQRVEAVLSTNRLDDGFGLGLSTRPELTLFSGGVPARFGRFRKVG